MHRQECFAYLNMDGNSLPETEKASEEILNLPIFPSLGESQQLRVVETIGEYFLVAAKRFAPE